ncbi:DUF4136 domain-containing protein [Aestuariivivens sediminis]|uniref:DUF4136 domain-containing protein n=1 Tax=Aestuariivivens sediminis TaxID=2913557 RepID=UPI001F5975E1|nr:DUF4136 domain-containing protein [Aestuariivivens sediminis]
MKLLCFFSLFILLTSCAPIRVNYDFEKSTDFSKYRTYNYYVDMQTGLSAFDTQRLLNALDEGLKSRGFMPSDTPGFFIDIKSSEFQQVQRNTVGVGLGGSGRNVGGGISIGLPIGQANVNRQIIFDFVDEQHNQGLFWQAVSEFSMNPSATPENREALFKAVVKKVLDKYPPKF